MKTKQLQNTKQKNKILTLRKPMTTILTDFNLIDANGYMQVATDLIPEHITNGTLITLTSPSAHTPKFATLYQRDQEWCYLRVQD